MKSLIKFGTLSIMLLLLTTNSFAQKKKKSNAKSVSEGHITYTMSADGAMAAMLNGSKMDLYFAPDHAKMSMDMAGMMKMNIIVDNKKKEGVMLMDMMGQRKAAKMDKDDLSKQKEDQVNKKPGKTEYKNNYKKIAGYKCQEVHVTMDGFDEPAVVYVTDKIKPANVDNVNMQFQGLNGFPLSWTITKMGMKMTMEASEVSLSKVDKKIFKMDIPEGYEEMTLEEMQNMGGTMGL